MKELVKKARDFASKKHEGQTRRDGRPYIVHPDKVASLLDDDLLKAIGLLHDTIEDTDATYEELEKEFGPSIAILVNILTHKENENYEQYIKRIKDKSDDFPLLIKIKIADIVANLSDSPTEKQIKKYTMALTYLTTGEFQ